MKKIILLFVILFLSSCVDGDMYDGLILIDQNTNKTYLIRHNIGDTYFIDEKQMKIQAADTTFIFD